MELVEQFFEKCEGEFVYLEVSDYCEIQSPKRLSEIKKIIEITDPCEEVRELLVVNATMDSQEEGFTKVEILDKKNLVVYILFESHIRFNKRSYVLTKISEENGSLFEDILLLGETSLENSFLTNAQVVVGNRLLKANYLAISIGEEWFVTQDRRFTEGLNRYDKDIKFEKIFLD